MVVFDKLWSSKECKIESLSLSDHTVSPSLGIWGEDAAANAV